MAHRVVWDEYVRVHGAGGAGSEEPPRKRARSFLCNELERLTRANHATMRELFVDALRNKCVYTLDAMLKQQQLKLRADELPAFFEACVARDCFEQFVHTLHSLCVYTSIVRDRQRAISRQSTRIQARTTFRVRRARTARVFV